MGPEFSVLARPLQQLLKQKTDFQWTAAHSSAVQALKGRLIHHTRLSLPYLTKPIILRTDASGVAIGAVLEQDSKPLGLLSKRLSDAEMRYSTYDEELLAIVRALGRWQHFLIAAELTVYNDNQELQYLTKLRCDRPTPLNPILTEAHEYPPPFLHDNVLASPQSSLSDPEMQGRILCQHHDLPTAGHLGISKTYNQIAMKFYWKDISDGDGYDIILTVVESLSELAHFIPTTSSLCTADLFAYLLIACAWHPQTDGQKERANRTIEQTLHAYIQSREEEWPYLLPALEFA
ncbi:hypothetical protein Esti_005777 [Eimeria stiedai]